MASLHPTTPVGRLAPHGAPHGGTHGGTHGSAPRGEGGGLKVLSLEVGASCPHGLLLGPPLMVRPVCEGRIVDIDDIDREKKTYFFVNPALVLPTSMPARKSLAYNTSFAGLLH